MNLLDNKTNARLEMEYGRAISLIARVESRDAFHPKS
jgi:hypothetical protein